MKPAASKIGVVGKKTNNKQINNQKRKAVEFKRKIVIHEDLQQKKLVHLLSIFNKVFQGEQCICPLDSRNA